MSTTTTPKPTLWTTLPPTYSPPQECWSQFQAGTPLVAFVSNHGLPFESGATCQPTAVLSSRTLAYQGTQVNIAFPSCPSGWWAAQTTVTAGSGSSSSDTQAWCCPISYTLFTQTPWSFGGLCQSSVASGQVFTYATMVSTTGTETWTSATSRATTSSSVQAFPIIGHIRAVASPTSSPTSSSTTSGTSSPTGEASPSSSSSGSSSLSSGAKTGIGIGVGLVIAAVILGFVVWFLRRRKAKSLSRIEGKPHDAPFLNYHTEEAKKQDGSAIHELHEESRRAELWTNSSRIELGDTARRAELNSKSSAVELSVQRL